MKISKLINIVQRKANGEIRKMRPAEISAIFAVAKTENQDLLKLMCETEGNDLSKIMEAAFNVGRKAAYDDVTYMLEERREMERSGNVRRLLSQLKDNGVVFEGSGLYRGHLHDSSYSRKLYTVVNLPEDVEL